MISLRNKIGQMLIIGFNGTVLDAHNPVTAWLEKDGLGGVILFDYDMASEQYGKNILNQAQIKQLIKQLNQHNASSNNLPLLTAIDYEGGAVDRLSKVEGCMQTLFAKQQARLSEEDFVEEISQMAETLSSLGFNLNFAPVVDLDFKNGQGIIGHLNRCFSSDPYDVARLSKLFVQGFNQKGIACCYKHFPGHGSATGDTHEGCVDVTDSFDPAELIPYQQLITEGNEPVMIMTAHVINRKLDGSGLPATLSYTMLTELLRQEFGYDGVIVSDDLQMKAIASNYSMPDALRMTINAGADMLIFANQLAYHTADEIIDMIEQLVIEETISTERIDEAYCRIVRLKKELVL